MFNLLEKFWKQNAPLTSFLLTVSFYGLLSLSSNNKVMVLFFGLYIFIFSKISGKFSLSLLLAYIASWPILVGKTYFIELVSAGLLYLPGRPFGIATTVVISIQEILALTMVLVLLREYILLNNKKIFKVDAASLLLGLFALTTIIASLLGSLRPLISVVHSLYFLKPLVFYWYLRWLAGKEKSILLLVISIFAAFITLESIVAGLQFFTRGPIGSGLELAQDAIRQDYSTDAISWSFRPAGTFSHANVLAHVVLPYVGLFLPILFFRYKKMDKVIRVVFFLSMSIIIISLSRSAWISLFIAAMLFLFFVEKVWHQTLKIRKQILWLMLLLTVPVVIFSSTVIFPRVVGSFSSFDTYGAGYARVELTKEAFKIIGQFPLFGVGIGMDNYYSYLSNQHLPQSNPYVLYKNFSKDIFTMYVTSPSSLATYFPESVHNGYIRLVVRSGVFPLIIFVAFTTLFAKAFFHRLAGSRKKEKILLLAAGVGVGAMYVNSLLQPTLPDLQLLSFIYLTYLNKRVSLSPLI